MKKRIRILFTVAALCGVFTASADARADTKQECADAYELTQSLRETERLRDARIQAAACSASTCSVYVTKDCLKWLTEIDAILPTVIFAAKDGAGADALAVRVTVDGQMVTEMLGGEAMPLDPGEHWVRFEMVGAEAIEQKVTIQQGEKDRKLVASFKKSPSATPPAPLPAVALPPTLAAPKPHVVPEPAPGAESGGGMPFWVPISGSFGVIALGISTGFAVRASSVPNSAQRTAGRNLSIGFGAAALVGIGAAVIGAVTTPSKASPPQKSFLLSPFGSPTGGGLTMQAQF